MGAACSASALAKYKVLKGYVQSKECLTFTSIHGFLSRGRHGGGPPIVLIGENHARNESDNLRKRCATTLAAMSKIVSDCETPTSRLLFFVESVSMESGFPVHPFFERFGRPLPEFVMEKHKIPPLQPRDTKPIDSFRDIPYKEGLKSWQPQDENQQAERFSILQVRRDIKTYASLYASGLVPVNYDLFHLHRAFLSTDKFMMELAPEMGIRRLLHLLKESILGAYAHAGTINGEARLDMEDVVSQMDDIDKRTATQMETDRSKVQHQINQGNERFATAIEEKTLPFCYFWMYHMTQWIANFTMGLIESKRAEQMKEFVISDDTSAVLEDIQRCLAQHNSDPAPHTFLDTFSACGDAMTYLLYVRPRMNVKHANEVLVLYGGSLHADNFARWIKHASYSLDLERSTEEKVHVASRQIRRQDDSQSKGDEESDEYSFGSSDESSDDEESEGDDGDFEWLPLEYA